MNSKTNLIIALLCFTFMYANAQDKKRIGSYHLGIGLSVHSVLDEGYAPMTFNSFSPNFIFSFQRDKNNNRIGYGLNAVYGKANYNNINRLATQLIDVDLFALYARALDFGNEKTSFHLGAIANYRAFVLLNWQDDLNYENQSYTLATSLGLYLNLDYQLNDQNKLSINFKHPLLASIVRPPYTGFSQYTDDISNNGNNLLPVLFFDPELAHGLKFFRPSIELKLERKMNSNKIFVPKLSCEYLSYSSINPIKYFRTNFSLGIKF